ncbi:DUF7344 domain-containing protein [Halomicrococcus sp. NG-SE-24]|uniref:DUF7344 domain-containing protein n=1 Tax=Halomicrococcus sp. NG-SE-24 TaxID=3436928 RepID=UPI003D97F082
MTAPSDNDYAPTSRHSLDTVFELLADAQRRAVLQYFTTQDTDVAELTELAAHVHGEINKDSSQQRVQLTLCQIHLPKLAEHGVIEYDQRSQTVRYRGGATVEALLTITMCFETPVR